MILGLYESSYIGSRFKPCYFKSIFSVSLGAALRAELSQAAKETIIQWDKFRED